MSRAESAPAYVTRCIAALLDALCEAHELARGGHLDGRFAETIRFATDLLEMLNENRDVVAGDPRASDDLDVVRERVRKLSSLFPASRTVH